MGRAIATACTTSGHSTTVWNRTPGKETGLDVTVAETASEAITASPLVIVCVLNYPAAQSILDAEALKGRTLLNLTGGSPEQAREMATWAADHGIAYLDGVILNGIVGGPDAALLYSGSSEIYAAQQHTLAALGENGRYLGEDPGQAAGFNMSLLDLFWTSMFGVVHSFQLAAAENISPAAFNGPAKDMTTMLPDLIDLVTAHLTSHEFPGDASTIDSAASILDDVIETARAGGVDADLLRAGRAAVQRAIEAGHGAEGFSRLAVR
ncbi:beta-hydroxyacid dehydrogenase, 3-hydroxyisobutyrate dehydrogenase [Actinoalloteichus hymeniacidonis]|uniref:Beta-hydroxyacid dehydrogenase, 3-hydroxyisobutyrate dehydrogenase n=2 Tax=Actinoalloteichus hymeniacidonis TaxID=340345 RepID=A0AAC9HVI1_9PSEU|nr:beta-hydroxyacid dehydrogenase, 3-hydroxyisobutyrate dehydrogenase [Actinoalloteichus hymeniacidonis]